jgi:hypothetical protein
MDDTVSSSRSANRIARSRVGSALFTWNRRKYHHSFHDTRKPRNVFIKIKLPLVGDTPDMTNGDVTEQGNLESQTSDESFYTAQNVSLRLETEEQTTKTSKTEVKTNPKLKVSDRSSSSEHLEYSGKQKSDGTVEQDIVTQEEPMEVLIDQQQGPFEEDMSTSVVKEVKKPPFQLIQVFDNACLAIIDQRKIFEKTSFLALYRGAVKITLLHGSLAVNGYDLIVGKTVESSVGLAARQFVYFEKGRQKGTTNGSPSSSILKALTDLTDNDKSAVVEIMRYINSFVPQLSDVGLVLFEKWDDHSEICWIRTVGKQLSNIARKSPKSEDSEWFEIIYEDFESCIGDDWDVKVDTNVLSQLSETSVVMTVGEGNRGKSNLLKRTINRLMSGKNTVVPKIVYLDLDLGQTEFSPAGQVTATLIDTSKETGIPLISEPCFHHVLFRSSVIASYSCLGINVELDPTTYISSVKYLLSEVKRKHSKVPIFINTMGFVTGVGRLITTEIIQLTLPTHVIEIQSERLYDGYPRNAEDHLNAMAPAMNYKAANVCGSGARIWSERQMSNMSAVEYVHVVLLSKLTRSRSTVVSRQTRTSHVYAALSNIVGVTSSILSLISRKKIDLAKVIFHVESDSCKIPADPIHQSLDRSFVQLIRCSNSRDDNCLAPMTQSRIKIAYQVTEPKVIGHGILFFKRGQETEVEVLTSLDEECFKEVNCVFKPLSVFLTSDLIRSCSWN